MKIEMTPELQSALVQRLKAEMIETFTANLALDMLSDSWMRRAQALEAELAETRQRSEEHAAALMERNKNLENDVARLQEEARPGFAHNRKPKD